MKKTVLHVALFSLALPFSVLGLGLGDMKIESALDQPFKAEIELIDAADAPLSGIRVNLADLANFERVGIERTAVLSLLFFSIDKNTEGKPVIKVFSQERMTEPFMEMVIDVAWPDGQLYKAYTILLDPPGYHLSTNPTTPKVIHVKKQSKAQYGNEPGVVDKTIISTVDHTSANTSAEPSDGRAKSTYGPTVTNENIWQIAQRYKSSDVILAQVVLAIVGANPGAFTDGNLNGLKVGVRLNIPASSQIQEVPIGSVNEEVAAHDTAWNDKTAIQHVIAPPYMGAKATIEPLPILVSEIPAAPKFTGASSMSQLILNGSAVLPINNKGQIDPNKKAQIEEQDAKTKAEIAITTAAIETVRESNSLLMDQLKILQNQNQKLQDQLTKRDQEMEAIRNQMQVLMKERLAIASQASTPSAPVDDSPNFMLFFLLVILVSGGTTFAFMYFRRRELAKSESTYLSSAEPLREPIAIEGESKAEEKESSDTPSTNTPMISAKSVVEETKPVVEETKPVVEETKPVVEETIPVVEETIPVVEETIPVVEETKPVVEETKPVVEETKPVVEETKPVVEETKPEEAKPKSMMDNFNSIIDNLKTVTEIPKSEDKDSALDVKNLKSTIETLNQPEPTEQHFIERTQSIIQHSEHSSPEIAEEVEFFKTDEPAIDEPVAGKAITEDPIISVENDIVFEKVDDAKTTIQVEKKSEPFEDENQIKFELTTKDDLQSKPAETPPVDGAEDDSFIEFNMDLTNDTSPKANLFDESNRSVEQDEELLEFETGLHETIEEPAKVQTKEDHEEDRGIEFITANLELDDDEENFLKHLNEELPETSLDETTGPEEAPISAEGEDFLEQFNSDESKPTQESTAASPLKSEKALETLLALAKTYLGMDDFESARHSLEEVEQYGNTAQKEEATRLLNEIKDK